MTRAVDTNVVVRFLVGDGSDQALQARAVFEKGVCTIPVSVMLETEWILRSVFEVPQPTIAEALARLLSMKNAKVMDRPAVDQAMKAYRNGLDFADALHVALSDDCKEFVTFDTKLRKKIGQHWPGKEGVAP